MIAFPWSVNVWLTVGRTDMRRSMNGLTLQVQQALGRDPHAWDRDVFRGARGDLIKILWHNGIGMSLYTICQPCRLWPRAGPVLADLGSMSALTGLRGHGPAGGDVLLLP